MCADRQEAGGEVYCKPCDVSSFDWDTFKCGASLASEGRAFNNYCQSNLLPPEGCQCDDVYERSDKGPMAGYVKADEVYFGRGSIQVCMARYIVSLRNVFLHMNNSLASAAKLELQLYKGKRGSYRRSSDFLPAAG